VSLGIAIGLIVFGERIMSALTVNRDEIKAKLQAVIDIDGSYLNVITDLCMAQERHKFLRIKQVMDCTAIGRSSIYNKVKQGTFPPPIRLPGEQRCTFWTEKSVQDWMQAQIDQGEG